MSSNVLKNKFKSRIRRSGRLRARNIGQANSSTSHGRVVVLINRTNQHIYAQAVDFSAHKSKVVAYASTAEKLFEKSGTKVEQAKKVGMMLGERLREKSVSSAILDRNGFKFHGRVKSLKEGLLELNIQV